MHEESARQAEVSDIYLVAYLAYHGIEYSMRTKRKRVSFVFTDPAADDLIQDYYKSDINRYVEQLKQVKVNMYQEKDKN